MLHQASAQTPAVEVAFPDLTFAQITDIQSPNDGTNRVFVLQKNGLVLVFANSMSTSQMTTFLNLSATVNTNGEGGLVGLAFHPEYASNGRFFVYYTTTVDEQFVSRVSEFQVSSDPDVADPASEIIRLQVAQPGFYHNSGQLQFGLDSYLYVAFGDGMASFESAADGEADPFDHGQDAGTLLSAMLRLDVDGGGNIPDCGDDGTYGIADYGIPVDNPLTTTAEACDEIYAYGFRNPFRYSFAPDGRLWLADVGEEQREEINWVEAGKNYGWSTKEGSLCFDPSSGCDETGLTDPVWEYVHPTGPDASGRSITGGYVIPSGGCSYIEGDYVFGDFITGQIWRLDPDDAPFQSSDELIDTDLMISTFGLGPDGNLLIGQYGDSGNIYRFDCTTLPVELAAFTGHLRDGAVFLSWTTVSEAQNAGFEVQHRAPTASAWRPLGFVEGKGTTATATDYRFDAGAFTPGVHAFRLRQIDADGTVTLSREVRVVISPSQPIYLSAVAPNPLTADGTVSLTVADAQSVRVRLYDVLGREVVRLFDGPVFANQPVVIPLPTSTLGAGLYFLRADGSSGSVTQKVVVAR
jgi:hypothetical protein